MSRHEFRIARPEQREPDWVADVPGGSFLIQSWEKKTDVFFRPTGRKPRAEGSFYGAGHPEKARRYIASESCFHGLPPDDGAV